MPAADLDLLVAAARAAGNIALSYTGPSAQVWHKPDGAGPVTEADLAVNDMLDDMLRSARPDYGWLSEETLDTPERLKSEYVFIVDPIDGTRSFIEGSNTWAHSLAIARNGKIIAAVVFLPMQEKLYTASLGAGAYLDGTRISPTKRTDLRGAQVLAAKPIMHPDNWRDMVPDFIRSHRPSLAYRLSLIAEGQYDAMLTLRPTWEWDIAAGALILEEAGAVASDRTGGPLRFNNPDPRLNGVVAGGPDIHKLLTKALAP